jgi:hypothetical protein
MAEDDDARDRQIQAEARARQGFSVASAIGREGGTLFKGEAIVPALVQATNALCVFTDAHLPDPSGALHAVMKQTLKTSETRIGAHLDDPFVALLSVLDDLLGHEHRLFEFVRQVDFEWGQLMDERPHFQRAGQAPHPDDEHTHASVRAALETLRGAVQAR